MRIFHIATLADWQSAQASGTYTTSTLGRTLAEEGFIHASRGDQWQGVRERFYAEVTEPLVLLSIDTGLLTSPVVEEAVPGTDETFPHIFGPIQVDSVVTALPLTDSASPPVPAGPVAPAGPPPSPGAAPAAPTAPVPDATSFSRLFLQEVFKQLVLASLVLGFVVLATVVGLSSGRDWGPITGAAVGLVLGVLAARELARRRSD